MKGCKKMEKDKIIEIDSVTYDRIVAVLMYYDSLVDFLRADGLVPKSFYTGIDVAHDRCRKALNVLLSSK